MVENCRACWERKGYTVLSVNNSVWDVCAVRADTPTALIQCKVVENKATAERLMKRFKEHPPFIPGKFHHLVLEVKVKGMKDPISLLV